MLHKSLSAFTLAISGIDASGKGYITKLVQEELERRGLKVANINIDPWQNPTPGGHNDLLDKAKAGYNILFVT
jgi:putative protein kinase ArgK-like GTPase of G3E family